MNNPAPWLTSAEPEVAAEAAVEAPKPTPKAKTAKAAAIPTVDEPSPVSAAARLAKLEDESFPLRDRLTRVDAALAQIDARLPTLNIEAEIDARKEIAAMQIERGVVASRLELLEPKLAEARRAVKAEAEAQAKADAIDQGLAALAKVTVAREALAEAVGALLACRDEDRRAGIVWRMTPELAFPVASEATAIGGVAANLSGVSR